MLAQMIDTPFPSPINKALEQTLRTRQICPRTTGKLFYRGYVQLNFIR
jgi:hypothetical protein